jgi:hypothetical protein
MDAVRIEDDEAWWRTFMFPEEDRRLFTSAEWDGGYRWFKSPNVICIERHRARLGGASGK